MLERTRVLAEEAIKTGDAPLLIEPSLHPSPSLKHHAGSADSDRVTLPA